jgi:hypothetical protein
LASIGVGCLCATNLWAQQETGRIKSFDDVYRVVEHYFANQSGFVPGSLINRKMGHEVFNELKKRGWSCPHEKEIIERMLVEDEFLVSVLSTSKGQEFLGKIRAYPDGIDRLDRMSRLPYGKESVTDLVNKVPNGADWIKALTTTMQGMKVGESLSKAEKGKDFNKPTGRIYFVEQFVKHLRESYERSRTNAVTAPSRRR